MKSFALLFRVSTRRVGILFAFALGSFSGFDASGFDPDDGLVAWYPFDGNASDMSGNGNDGTLNGPVLATDRHGEAGKAYSFDGTNDFIDFGDVSAINFSTNDFTISAWINTASGVRGEITNKGSNLSNTGYNMFVANAGQLSLEIHDLYPCLSSGTVNDGTWRHALGMREGDNLKLFIDGEADGTLSGVNNLDVSTSNTFYVGSREATTPFFNGSIDDIRIYDRALSAADVLALYSMERVNTAPTDLNSTALLTIAENQPVGTIVGEFNATDPEGNAITYHLVSGEGDGNNSLFTLDANGSLSTAVVFDYEADAPTYSIRVQAKDEYNATLEGNFTVLLRDAFEPNQSTYVAHSAADLEMIWVEPGTFTMGSPTSEAGRGSDENETQVTLTQGFYLGKYEVTQAQYEAVMTDNNASLSPTPSNYAGSDLPVENVSWDEVRIFLERLNEQEADNLPPGWAYVLPTEAQWEYACRAGTSTVYFWGDDINASLANYNSNIGQTANVGSYGANPWGFFDMHGNVWEWTADRYGAYEAGPLTDPTGAASGSYRVLRGGSWFYDGTSLRSAKRYSGPPGGRAYDIGFRVGFQIQPDTASPELELFGGAEVPHKRDEPWAEPGYGASDERDGNLTDSVSITGSLDVNVTGTYHLTYSVTDAAGNESNLTRTVRVVDHFVELNATVDLDMIWVEPGTFTMGSPTSEVGRGTDENETQVTLTQGFYLGKYEVTQAQYEAVMTDNNASLSPTPSYWQGNPNRPVEQVSWDDIRIFLERLNDQEADNLPPGWAYVLPTEAQWEYACRAGTTTAYSWGDEINASLANYGNNIGLTANVGSYGANPWGFFDMHGNVWEWTADRYGAYEAGPLTDPTGSSSGSTRVLRGGSWFDDGSIQRSAQRNHVSPGGRSYNLGFRVGFQYDNKAPVDLNHTAPLVVAENQPIGTIVGEFNATDPEGGAITYHLVSGIGDGDNALFTLDANGTLMTNQSFDYESNASAYAIRVEARDELNDGTEGNFTVSLQNLNEAPVGEVTISGDAEVGRVLTADHNLSDEDGNGAVSFQWYRDGHPIQSTLKDGVNGADGLDGAYSVTLSADGNHVYVTGYDDQAVSWYDRNASTGALTYRGKLQDGVDGADGLNGAYGITLSADGNHAYVTGYFEDSISWYERNASTGALTYGGVLKDGVNGVEGLNGANGIALSADGNHAYVTGSGDDAVSWYERNASTGALTYVAGLQDGANGVEGLNAAYGITLSADGSHAYVTGYGDHAVSWYERNASTGALTYGGVLQDGVNGVDGLNGAKSIALSADGIHAYVTGGTDDAVSWFERNASTGALTYGGTLQDGVNGVDGLDGARDIVLSADGNYLYVIGSIDDAVSWYERNASAGALTYGGRLQDGVDGVDGLDGAQSVTLSADGKHAYVAGVFDDAVSWFERNASTGVLTYHRENQSTYTVAEEDLGAVIMVVASYLDGGGADENVSSAGTNPVIPWNDPPTDLNATAPLIILENQAVGAVVGEFNASDPNGPVTLIYTLVDENDQTDNSLFTLDANGTLSANASFDRETLDTYAVRVRVTDTYGKWMEQSFTVTVGDVNEAPVISRSGDLEIAVDEDSHPVSWPEEIPAAELNATDVDGDLLTWSVLTAPANGTATVSGSGPSPEVLNYLPNPDFNGSDSFVVEVSDGALSDQVTVSVRVNARPENQWIPMVKEVTYSMWPELGSDFLFTGGGYEDAPDPALTLLEGTRYVFEPQIGGLTLRVGTAVGVPYVGEEVEENPTGMPLGTVILKPDRETPRDLVYYVEEEAEMQGAIRVIAGREQKFVRPGQNKMQGFGLGMDAYGNQLAVGSKRDENWMGTVHLFEKDANGSWRGVTEIQPQTRTDFGYFGFTIAHAGSVLLVGAPSFTDAVAIPGQAHVFEQVGGVWTETLSLSPSISSASDRFGYGVDASPNRLVVGGPQSDANGLTNGGAVFIHDRESNGSWGAEQLLVPDDLTDGDNFGQSVSLDGDRLLVGAPSGANDYGHDTGVSYLFNKVGEQWVQETKFYPWDSNQTDNVFGQSVKLEGDLAYIGAIRQDRGADSQVGAVYVFRKSETGQWEPEVKLQPDDLAAYAWFGSALDAIGDSVLIGAPSSGDSANNDQPGLACWYQRDDSGAWNLEGRFQPYDGQTGDRFGRAVAMGSSLFVGAFGKDDHLLPNSGAAYAYENPNWNDTPPVLELEGTTISVEMDEDGAPVAWSAPSLSATDAGGDQLSWRAYYEDESEANGTLVVSGTGNSPTDFHYVPRKDFYGTDTFVVEVTDGVYAKTLQVRVTVNAQPDEGELLTLMMPGYGHSTLYANAEMNQPITVWGRIRDGQEPFTYSLDFGDGASTGGTVTDPDFIGVDHSYSTSGLKMATLEVEDANGQVSKSTTLIRVFLPNEITLDEKRNMAMDRGLLFLYRDAVEDARMDGLNWSKGSPNNLHTVAFSAMSVMAFTDFGFNANTPENLHAYGDLVRRALRFLVANGQSGTLAISNHSDGIAVRQTDDPNGHDPGRGSYLLKSGGHDSYSNSMAVMAVLTAFPNGVGADELVIDHGPFNGWNFHQLAGELVEVLMWSQGDGDKRGGWEYYIAEQQRRYDGSVQQWPVIALMTADEKWGLDVPQWVRENVDHAYEFLTDSSGAVSYSNGTNWLNVEKTGGHLIADAWMGRDETDPVAAPSFQYLANLWMSDIGWSNNLYAAYGVKKGLDFIGVQQIDTPWGSRDWDADMASWYLGIDNGFDANMNSNRRTTEYGYGQKADGSWDAVFLDSAHARRYSPAFTTANVLAILSRGVTDFPPVPAVNFPAEVPIGKSFALDGSSSYHSDPAKAIKNWKWMWDWNGSVDSIDWSQPDAIGPRPTHPGFSDYGSYSFALRVTDNGDPEQSVTEVFAISANSGNHEPIPRVIPVSKLPTYAARLGETILLDATTSFDLDDYDSITGYRWDLNGDGQFSEGNPTMSVGPFDYPYQARVGLQVNDESFASWSDPVYVDVFFSERDLAVVDLQTEPFNLLDQNFTLVATVESNASSVGIVRNQLVRFYDDNPFTAGSLLGEAVLPDLSPGSQTLASVNLPISSWVPTVYVLVDPYQRLPEWDETNNLGSFGIIPNYPPEDLLIEPAGLAENQSAGSLAGALTAVDRDDPDANGSYQFALATGEGDLDNASFEVIGNQIRSLRSFDFEEREDYLIRIRVTDDKGAAFEKALTLSISDLDDHGPLLSLIGDANLTHEAMTAYLDAGANWVDPIDAIGTLDENGTSSSIGLVNIAVPGSYQLRYEASDQWGNPAAPIFRTVVVRDTTPPNLFLQGLPEITLEAHTPFVDPGAFWVDALDGYGLIEPTGLLDLTTPGTYRIDYNHTDQAGNAAEGIFRTIKVIDTTPPVLALVGDSDYVHDAGTPFLDPGAEWTDAVDGNGVTLGAGTVEVMQLGAYSLTYEFADEAGNHAIPLSRSVEVLDRTPAVIELVGPQVLVLEAGRTLEDPGAVWTDAFDGNGTLLGVGQVEVSQTGEYLLAYDHLDRSGNQAETVYRTVQIVNDDPVDFVLSASRVEENLAVDGVVGQFAVDDPNDPLGEGQYYFEILTEGEKDIFYVDLDARLRLLKPLDFESQVHHSFEVKVNDGFGGSMTQSFELEVADNFLSIVDTDSLLEVGVSHVVAIGEVLDGGGPLGVRERGFVVSASADPILGGPGSIRKSVDPAIGSYQGRIDGLQSDRKYYLRAYAVNGEGVSYGSSASFRTLESGQGPGWATAKPEADAENWWTSPWFGSFNLKDESGWLYHAQLGWAYALSAGGGGVWLWTDATNWVWTDQGIYPFLFAHEPASWLYFHGRSQEQILFYRYSDNLWITNKLETSLP